MTQFSGSASHPRIGARLDTYDLTIDSSTGKLPITTTLFDATATTNPLNSAASDTVGSGLVVLTSVDGVA